MLSKEDLSEEYEYPAYSADSTNNGIIGYTNNPEFICNEQTPVYVTFGDHTRTMNIARKSFSVLDNVKVLIPCTDSDNSLLFIISSWQKQIPNLGYARHWKVAKNCVLQLPTKNGKPDFDFMESFVAELEAQKIAELEAYLLATGLKDYTLTEEEEKILKNIDSMDMKEYSLGNLFDIKNTLSFNSERLVDGNTYDYVTRTSLNQGILQKTGFINNDNINQDGCWSLGLLQMDFFYRKRQWYAGQFIRKVIPKFSLNENIMLYYTTLLNKTKPKLLSVLVRDVDATFKDLIIKLPVDKHGNLDHSMMETFISGIKKLVIKDVVLYATKKWRVIK